MRNSWQNGTIIEVKRKSGDQWRMRFRDGKAQRSEFLGTKRTLPTRAAAERVAARRLAIINGPRTECITISDLIARFEHEAMPSRPATVHSYKSILRRIEQDWGEKRIDQVATDINAVGEWLKTLKAVGRHPKPGAQRDASPMFKAQVRNIWHLLFEKAMLWKSVSIDRNPVSIIKLKDGSKRQKELAILLLEDYQRLLDDPELPLLVKTLVQVCVGLGLRISEALGLKWEALDFDSGELHVKRSVVQGEAGDPKTFRSRRNLPLHPELIQALKKWRLAEKPVNGWVFGSERTGKPLDRDWLRAQYLTPAGERIGVEGLGWHSLRHSYRALMRKAGLTLEDQRDLMGHAHISMTADVYGGREKVDELRGPHDKVVEMMKRRSA